MMGVANYVFFVENSTDFTLPARALYSELQPINGAPPPPPPLFPPFPPSAPIFLSFSSPSATEY